MQDKNRIPEIDQTIEHAEKFMFGSHAVKGFHTLGHTTGHMVYHFEDQNIAFVDDTLFAMGCGRLFEGRPEQMLNSLDIIMSWSDETMLYCAHEYTQSIASI